MCFNIVDIFLGNPTFQPYQHWIPALQIRRHVCIFEASHRFFIDHNIYTFLALHWTPHWNVWAIILLAQPEWFLNKLICKPLGFKRTCTDSRSQLWHDSHLACCKWAGKSVHPSDERISRGHIQSIVSIKTTLSTHKIYSSFFIVSYQDMFYLKRC